MPRAGCCSQRQPGCSGGGLEGDGSGRGGIPPEHLLLLQKGQSDPGWYQSRAVCFLGGPREKKLGNSTSVDLGQGLEGLRESKTHGIFYAAIIVNLYL